MTKVSLIAKLQTNPEQADEVEAALENTCKAAAEEAGLEIYSAHKDSAEDGVYWFFELFSHRFLAIGVRKYEISAVGARRNFRSRPLNIVNHTD